MKSVRGSDNNPADTAGKCEICLLFDTPQKWYYYPVLIGGTTFFNMTCFIAGLINPYSRIEMRASQPVAGCGSASMYPFWAM
jgi:hypothetical protein